MSTNIERAAEVRAAVVEAMQTSWDEFVGDTGCYPDCFSQQGKLLYADFRMGNFATWVADRLLAAEGLLVTDEQQRLIALGKAVEAVKARNRSRWGALAAGLRNDCLDAIYAEAERGGE